VRRTGELLGRDARSLGIVVAHLGSGCSVTAVRDGRSVDTSMGMTPLEGLMMGTRAGSIDPGILLRILDDRRMGPSELADVLDHRAGLLAVSGGISDMRELIAAVDRGDERARLAVEMFVRRAAAGIAAAATTLDRLDAVVFTGGIGEHAGAVRAAIVRRLAVLGAEPVGTTGEGDAVLSRPDAVPAVLLVEAREDLVIAAEVERLVSRQPAP
jgi:acetate kinase